MLFLLLILSLMTHPVLAGAKKTVPENKGGITISPVPFDEDEEMYEPERKQFENRENRGKEYLDAHPGVKGPNKSTER